MLLLMMATMKIATMTKLIEVFRADKSSYIQYVGVGVSLQLIYSQIKFTVMLRFTVFISLAIYALLNSNVGSSNNQTLSYLRHKLTTIFLETYCEW